MAHEGIYEINAYYQAWLRSLLEETMDYSKFIECALQSAHEIETSWKDVGHEDGELNQTMKSFISNIPKARNYLHVENALKETLAGMSKAENLPDFRTDMMVLVKLGDQMTEIENMFSHGLRSEIRLKAQNS